MSDVVARRPSGSVDRYVPVASVSHDARYIWYGLEPDDRIFQGQLGYGDNLVYLHAEGARAGFNKEVAAWDIETMFASSPSVIFENVHFTNIVGMGPIIIPLLLEKLQEPDPGFWYVALARITGENVASESDAGSTRMNADAWLNWGRQKHYI